MRRDASADKRDYDVDTKAMVGFAKKLFDRSWMKRIYSDLEIMNGGKVGHPYVYKDAMIIWALTIKIALGTSFRMAEGILNSFLDEKGYSNISHSRFVARCNELMATRQEGYRRQDPGIRGVRSHSEDRTDNRGDRLHRDVPEQMRQLALLQVAQEDRHRMDQAPCGGRRGDKRDTCICDNG